MNNFNLSNVEKNLKINFNNKRIIQTAFTHSSYAKQFKESQYNERLEFLGDSVLQLTITEYLFSNYKNKLEGELTRLRSLIVCENSLYNVARKLGISDFIMMSKGEELTGGRDRISIQADAVEAIIAAIYIDKGLEVAKEFILTNFNDIIKKAIDNKIILDFKTKLQELIQADQRKTVTYELLSATGPSNNPVFEMAVKMDDMILGTGIGSSKKRAEQQAAKDALNKLAK